MFKHIRKSKKELNVNETENILYKGDYGILATIGDNGYPYGLPINYVFYNGFIYFHCAGEGHKLDNIKENNKVSFTVVDFAEIIKANFNTKYKSCIVFGEIFKVEDEEKEEALLALIDKYSPEFLKQGKKHISVAKDVTVVIKIEINHMTGKGSV